MKKIAIFLNGPILGGAERSIIQQVSLVKVPAQFTLFIPQIKGYSSHEMEEFIHSQGRFDCKLFPFPEILYKASRSGGLIKNVARALSLPLTVFFLSKKTYSHFDILWANGNKIAFLLFINCFFSSYRGNFFWHFRDYPSHHFPFSWIWKFIQLPKKFKLTLLSNSDSVRQAVNKVITNRTSSELLYNVVGHYPKAPFGPKVTIGSVSMLAPWKGIHQLIIMASLYEKKLQDLGVVAINIYGEDIYITAGEHQNYSTQLKNIHEKFPSSLIVFKGKKSPKEIYQDIDILIHTAIQEEPFGRIIVEAFSAGIPVVSTALGGAAELVTSKTGWIFQKYDYLAMYEKIRDIIEIHLTRNEKVAQAEELYENISTQVEKKINELILSA